MIHALPILLATFGFNAGAAAPVCQIEGAQDNLQHCIESPCSTAERTRSVRFPDGREITVIGHRHGDRSLSRQLAEQLFLKDTTALPERFLKSIRRDDPTAAQHAADDFVYLKRYLKRQTQAVFVGMESYDSNIPYHLQRWSGLKDRLAQWEQTDPPPKVQRAKETIMQVLNPNLYLYVTSPELFKKAYIKGFESEALENDEARIDQYREDLFTQVEAALADDQKHLEDMQETRAAFIFMNESYDPAVDNAKVMESVQTNPDIPPQHRPLILQWIAAELATLNARLMRDRVTSFNMVNEKRSGILFVGELHLNAIARLLQDACVRQQRGESPAPIAYGATYYGAPVQSSSAAH